MKLEFQTLVIDMGNTKDEAPPVIEATSDTFSSSIITADAAIRSWKLEFTRSDHEVHQIFAEIQDVQLVDNATRVKVSAKMGIRDDSGDWDDVYSGSVTALIIASVSDN